jgi:hypothetical protein
MKQPYLEVTYRRGRPIAAYLDLLRNAGDTSHRTERVEPGMVIDFTADGRPMGIEITAPTEVSLAAINGILERLGLSPVTQADLAPLEAA